jgi:radical SAM protein with 4Fe4S-binding SPASM domain
MCNIWKYPSDEKKEISPKDLEKLPSLKFANVTGGEPFQRRDLEDIISVLFTKAPRVVISTSGWHYEKIVSLAERFPKIGIRVSIEGLSQRNDELRGRQGGFDNGLKVLLKLRSMGIKDIGFGITVSNQNSEDMLWLYKLAKELKLEFATAAFHNSFYFHKEDNQITNRETVINHFKELIKNLLYENNPKSWARAFFNLGLINYIQGGKRMLPCEAGSANFFIEPYGDVYPCNGLEDKIWKESMGNIHDFSTFEELWHSEQANRVRDLVKICPKNCWMVGTAAPVMKKNIRHPAGWIIENKIRSALGREICIDKIPYYNVGQDPMQGDLNYSRMQPFTDISGVKPDPTLSLIEE